MTIAIDDLIEIELAEGSYLSLGSRFYAGDTIDISALAELEFSGSNYFASGGRFYSPNTVDLSDLFPLEFTPESYFDRRVAPVYNYSRLQYLELIPVVLPMQVGDTGFEISFLFRDTPDLTSEDLLDILTYAGDIRLSLEDGAGTLEVRQNDLDRDAGLETALLVSLFTDRRATLEQVRAAGMDESDLRGWWGDEGEEEPIGSHVWLLGRAKVTPETMTQFREYALQAWEWLIQDGAAEAIDAVVERADLEAIRITVTVKRPRAAENVNFRWYYNWQAQQVRRA